MKKNNYIVLLFIVLFGCTQKPAEIVHKNNNIYTPRYTETYIESPDGKIARSLRGNNDSNKAQEISIINKNAIVEQDTDDYYTVRKGDSLWTISKKFDMKVQDLAELNNIEKPYNIKPGQKLIISDENKIKNIKTEASTRAKSLNLETYTVKFGDNLSTIAENHNMSLKEIMELNNIKKPHNINVGQRIKIKSNKKSSKSTSSIYIVKSGDNLSTIAENHNMSLKEIAEINNLKQPYNIKIGQKIKVTKNTVVVKTNPSVSVASNSTIPPKTQVTKKANSFSWPIKGKVISTFGNKPGGLYNDGINISAPKGTSFKSTEDGVVAYVGNELRGYGTIILIKHNNNWISAYAHCESVNVSRGDRVKKGETIGTVGQSGNVTEPQLYFSLRNGREAVDPIKYLE